MMGRLGVCSVRSSLGSKLWGKFRLVVETAVKNERDGGTAKAAKL